jgi:hypothetical protein
MARKKRSSSMLTKAENRAIGLEEIDPPLNFGPNNNLATLKTSISKTKKLLESYNMKLSELDVVQNDLADSEAELRNLCSTLLSAAGALYGKDSNEYELAGGTRTSERKSSARKPKPAPSI